MFSFALKVISYVFSALITVVSVLLFCLLAYLLINPYASEIIIVDQLGLPYSVVTLMPWMIGVTGVLLLGPIALICANFFQQSRIIDLLEIQINEIILTRIELKDTSREEQM